MDKLVSAVEENDMAGIPFTKAMGLIVGFELVFSQSRSCRFYCSHPENHELSAIDPTDQEYTAP